MSAKRFWCNCKWRVANNDATMSIDQAHGIQQQQIRTKIDSMLDNCHMNVSIETNRCRFTNMRHSRFGWGQIRTRIFLIFDLASMHEGWTYSGEPNPGYQPWKPQDPFLIFNVTIQHLTKLNAVLLFAFGSMFVWFWVRKTEVGGSEHSLNVVMRIAGQTSFAYLPVHIDGSLVRKNWTFLFCQRCVCQCGFDMIFPQTWKILIMVDLNLQRKTNETCDPIHKQFQRK